jgi:hypothetical protein
LIEETQKSMSFRFIVFNEILDTIAVARGGAALSWERVGRGYDLIFKALRRL